jgi:gliding motility-associated-like protein
VEVEVRPIPVFELPADTLLCPGDVLSLETGLTDVLVTWSTGQVGETIEVNQAQTYIATSQVSGCQHVDSTVVDISQPIAVPLSVDYELCLDDTLILDASQAAGVYASTYRWENGSMEPRRILDRAGVFTVEVANVCDTVEHILEVKQVVCGCQVFVPTAFTPNNDGKNDAWIPFLDCDDMYSYKATVYDRWGRPVFFSDDPEEVWFGQVEGTPGSKTRESGNTYAIDGVYMWEVIIELRRDRIPEVIRQNGYIRVLR